jgi:hypothetical protein
MGLRSKPDSPAAEGGQRLFPSIPILKERDPVFLKHGLERGGIELRGMSQSPRPSQPATFLFKLRALFGMQARAEVMGWLLANDQGHPAEIARQTGYFRGSIQNVLNDLTTSGHIGSIRIGREKTFSYSTFGFGRRLKLSCLIQIGKVIPPASPPIQSS